MKFAFSTLAAPTLDLVTLASRAREAGYDGIDLGAPVPAGAVVDAGLEVACMESGIAMPHGRRARARAVDDFRRVLDLAAMVQCRRVRVSGGAVHAGTSASVAVGKWLAPLAELAAGQEVTLLLRTDGAVRRAHDMWLTLESIDRANVAASWNLAGAAESPYVAVPTLNSRMRYVMLPDTVIPEAGPLVTRLMGIGYDGYVAVAGPTADMARDLANLRTWTKPPVLKGAAKATGKGTAVAAAAAARSH